MKKDFWKNEKGIFINIDEVDVHNIEITKCSSSFFWYNKNIGNTYNVVEINKTQYGVSQQFNRN